MKIIRHIAIPSTGDIQFEIGNLTFDRKIYDNFHVAAESPVSGTLRF